MEEDQFLRYLYQKRRNPLRDRIEEAHRWLVLFKNITKPEEITNLFERFTLNKEDLFKDEFFLNEEGLEYCFEIKNNFVGKKELIGGKGKYYSKYHPVRVEVVNFLPSSLDDLLIMKKPHEIISFHPEKSSFEIYKDVGIFFQPVKKDFEAYTLLNVSGYNPKKVDLYRKEHPQKLKELIMGKLSYGIDTLLQIVDR